LKVKSQEKKQVKTLETLVAGAAEPYRFGAPAPPAMTNGEDVRKNALLFTLEAAIKRG